MAPAQAVRLGGEREYVGGTRRPSPLPLGPCYLDEVSGAHGAQQDLAALGVGEFPGGGLPVCDRVHQRSEIIIVVGQ